MGTTRPPLDTEKQLSPRQRRYRHLANEGVRLAATIVGAFLVALAISGAVVTHHNRAPTVGNIVPPDADGRGQRENMPMNHVKQVPNGNSTLGGGPPGGGGKRALLDQHRDHLRTSGLTDETIAAAGIFSVTDGAEAGKLLGWSGHAPSPAIAFPYLDKQGATVMHILRPDTPRLKDGKPVKYESPVGVGPRLYFTPASLRPDELAQPGALHNPAVPLFLVEGIKKALCMAQCRALVISAQGTTVWHNIETRKGTSDRVLHPDFDDIPLKGRVVYIVFDGGDTTVNAPVIEAEAQLAKMLLDAGAVVHLLRIPHQQGAKMGIDDYLVNQPDAQAALRALCASSLFADPVLRARVAAQDRSDRARASLALLHDPSFAAALKVRDSAAVDVIVSELKVARIKKPSVVDVVETFTKRLRSSAQRAAPTSAPDPSIRAEADALLASSDIVEKLLASVAADGLVGEENAALTLALVAVTRKTQEPLHLAIKAASSSGKNFLVRKVMAHFPPEDIEDISEMTPQALLYLPSSLDGKIVIVAEHDGAERAQYSMRLAMSERKLTLWVPEKVTDENGARFVTQKREISCAASFITTTTRALLFEDNETRIIETLLDESSAQTRRIIESQACDAARPPVGVDAEREHRHKVWQEAMRLLEPHNIVVPQAKRIADEMPVNRVRARRDLPKIYGLAGAVATLFQRQRQVIGGCLHTTDSDVELARRLTQTMLSAVPAKLKAMADKLTQAFGTFEFTPNEATKMLGYSDSSTTAKHLNTMLEHDLVELTTPQRGNTPGKWRMVVPTPLPSALGNTNAAQTASAAPSTGTSSPPSAAPASPAAATPMLAWPHVPMPPVTVVPGALPASPSSLTSGTSSSPGSSATPQPIAYFDPRQHQPPKPAPTHPSPSGRQVPMLPYGTGKS